MQKESKNIWNKPESDNSKEVDRRKILAAAAAGGASLFLAGCKRPTEVKPVEKAPIDKASQPGPSAEEESPEYVEEEPESDFERQKQEFQEVGKSFGKKLIDDINDQMSYDKDYAESAPEGAVPEYDYRYYEGDPSNGIEPSGRMTVISPTLHTESGQAYKVEIIYSKLDPSVYGESDGTILANDLSGLIGRDIKEIDIIKYPEFEGDDSSVDYGDERSYKITTEIDIDEASKSVRIVDDAPYLQGTVSEAMTFEEAMSLTKELEESLEYVHN